MNDWKPELSPPTIAPKFRIVLFKFMDGGSTVGVVKFHTFDQSLVPEKFEVFTRQE
jgi:hypothetical protein